jgi:hypothetical protein
MLKVDRITFVASVAKVMTMVDCGIRISLDLPETAINVAAALMEAKRQGIALEVEIKFGGEKCFQQPNNENLPS